MFVSKLHVCFCIEVCYIEMCSEFCIEYIVFCMHFPYGNLSILVAMLSVHKITKICKL